MIPAEIIAGLRSCARQSDDAAASCEAQAAHHRPEFDRTLRFPDAASWADVDRVASKENHERAMELYEHVIDAEREARRLREEGELFRAAARLIEEMDQLSGPP